MGFGSPAAHNTFLVGHLPQCFQGFSPFRAPMITSQTANTLFCLVFFLLQSLVKCPWIPHTKQFPYLCPFLRSGSTANAAEHLCPFCLFAVLIVAFWVVTLCASFNYSFATDGPRFSSLQLSLLPSYVFRIPSCSEHLFSRSSATVFSGI